MRGMNVVDQYGWVISVGRYFSHIATSFFGSVPENTTTRPVGGASEWLFLPAHLFSSFLPSYPSFKFLCIVSGLMKLFLCCSSSQVAMLLQLSDLFIDDSRANTRLPYTHLTTKRFTMTCVYQRKVEITSHNLS